MMRRANSATAILVAAALAVPAYAQQPNSSEADIVVTGQELKDEQKVVCKKQAATGTRFAKRNCKTVREWNLIREQHMRDAREMIDRPQIETRRG